VETTLREIGLLEDVGSLLSWDQEVNLPAHGTEARAAQIAFITAEAHRRLTDPRFISLVRELLDAKDSSEEQRVNLALVLEDADRAAKLPTDFVSAQAELQSKGYAAWEEAKPRGDFAAVAPILAELIAMARREAEYVGFSGSQYNALLHSYEPYARIEDVLPVLLDLASSLAPRIAALPVQGADAAPLGFQLTVDQQRILCRKVIERIGFDFESGMLSESAHPFAETCGPHDQRLTVTFRESDPLDALYSGLHEAGHGLYEQGLRRDFHRQPLGTSVSLGWHESQSRFWENIVGRSEPFCAFLLQEMRTLFPGVDGLPLDAGPLWRNRNCITPGLIRIQADEVTYNLHIAIRTLIEVELVEGTLAVSDLPSRWEDLYQRYLGVAPRGHHEGVLQDPHWYCGLIGYFPTYTLGNLYSAMLWDKLKVEHTGVEGDIESGDFLPILSWLRNSVHAHGRRHRPLELCKVATGADFSSTAFLNYIDQKLGRLGTVS
jgi:carboxypeptidase Taq